MKWHRTTMTDGSTGYESECKRFRVVGSGRKWILIDAEDGTTASHNGKADACIAAAKISAVIDAPKKSKAAPTMPAAPSERIVVEMESLRLAIGGLTTELARLSRAMEGLELAE